MGRIIIVTATPMEQDFLRRLVVDLRLQWVVVGMGAGATAYGTMKAICNGENRPDLVILAGIAGAFPGSGLELGDVVLVEREYQGDMGAWRVETGEVEWFADREEMRELRCPYIKRLGLENLFPLVGGRSVNTACVPWGDARKGDAVENMEGAAFFQVCTGEGVPFLELRAVSNRVGDRRDSWRVEEALAVLGEGLGELLEKL